MKGIIRISAAIAVIAILAGCGASKMAVRPDATENLKTIALIEVSEPDAYVAQDFGNTGAMFGAVGGAMVGASSADAGKSVNQIVVDAKYAAGDHFTRSLTDKLSALGYQVNLISVTREKKQSLLESYDSVDSAGADAILDVAIESMGYATEHPMFSRHWRPASQVKVALIDVHSNKKVYEEKFMYGYHNPFMSGTDIDAPKTYHFKNKDELFADGDKLVAGIRNSVEAVVEQVQNNLKK